MVFTHKIHKKDSKSVLLSQTKK